MRGRHLVIHTFAAIYIGSYEVSINIEIQERRKYVTLIIESGED